MTTMYDAVTLSAIPVDPPPPIVAAYANGRFANVYEAQRLFPNALIVPIWIYIPGMSDPVGDAQRFASIMADLGLPQGSTGVADIEASDAGLHADDEGRKALRSHGFAPDALAANAPQAERERFARLAVDSGWAPTFADTLRATGNVADGYTSLSTWDAIRGIFTNYWIAHYTNQPHLIDGAEACQWTAPEAGSGGDYDISECRDGWPRRGAPQPPDIFNPAAIAQIGHLNQLLTGA